MNYNTTKKKKTNKISPQVGFISTQNANIKNILQTGKNDDIFSLSADTPRYTMAFLPVK